jgi:hypothetical protein
MTLSGVIESRGILGVGDIEYLRDMSNRMLLMEAVLVWGVVWYNVCSVCEAQTEIIRLLHIGISLPVDSCWPRLLMLGIR